MLIITILTPKSFFLFILTFFFMPQLQPLSLELTQEVLFFCFFYHSGLPYLLFIKLVADELFELQQNRSDRSDIHLLPGHITLEDKVNASNQPVVYIATSVAI